MGPYPLIFTTFVFHPLSSKTGLPPSKYFGIDKYLVSGECRKGTVRRALFDFAQ